jgi:hypothetical protein
MANRRVVFISRLKDEGIEARLIEDLKSSFPAEALRSIDGLEEITICQGHGMFTAIVEYEGDFEKIYADYISNASVRAFHAKLAAYLKDIPMSNKPADLPLLGDVLYWDGKKVKEAVG